jgi:ABC-type transport system involved in multi-copper enzyme maturation permease subunit
MNWLLWKDYRHNRLIVIAGLFFLLVPHLFALGIIYWANVYSPPGPLDWKSILAYACLYSIGFSGISLALISGNAIAGERVDRSAEFLYILPIARRGLLASKLLLALVVVAVPWLANVSLLWCLTRTASLPVDHGFPQAFAFMAIAELTCFCVSWFVSAIVASTSFATLAGLLSPCIVLWCLALIVWSLKLSGAGGDSFMWFWWHIICLTLAPVCFVVGTWHYLRRVEP